MSTAYFTATTPLNLARSCLNDAAGTLFSDVVLIPYLNSAYRKLQRGLSMSGAPLFIKDNALLVIPAVPIDPSTQVVINDTSSPQLPTDMLEPEIIEERPNLSGNNFVPMTDMTEHGGLISQNQGATLGVFEWRSDGIAFLGATQDTQIRIRYNKAFADVVVNTDPIYVRFSQDCLGYLTAAMASMARGSPLADKWAQAGEDGLENLISAATRREQYSIRRRKPFSSSSGAYSSNWRTGNW